MVIQGGYLFAKEGCYTAFFSFMIALPPWPFTLKYPINTQSMFIWDAKKHEKLKAEPRQLWYTGYVVLVQAVSLWNE